MSSNQKTARLAGLIYLIVVVTGIVNLAYVPSKLIVLENTSLTYNNIKNNETLFRFGILSGLLCYLAFLLLPIILYKLFNEINKTYALLMVAFATVSVPVSYVNMGNKFAILTLIDKSANIKMPEINKLQEKVIFYLQAYNNGNKIASIFWGLWLLPFGYLVFKSGFLPKILGVLLMFGCFGYLINFIGGFLLPNYRETIISKFITIPGSVGEIGICLWLLIVGVRNKKQVEVPAL